MTAPTGAIYDIGYQHYDGPRLGRVGAVRALYLHGLRSLFGIGRGGRAKVPPVALLVFMVVPALIQVAVVGLAGDFLQLFSHATYFRSTVWIFALFCAFQTPELVTRDRQYRVLALYFSKALRRTDYVLARLGALFTALFAVGLLPHVILLVGTWFASEDVASAMRRTLPVIPRIVAATCCIALLLSVVSLALSALINRRPLATASILAVFLLATGVVAPLVMEQTARMRYAILASPLLVADGTTTWIFDTTSTARANTAAAATPLVADSGGRLVVGDSAAVAERRARRRRRRQQTIVETANLPGSLYLLATAGFILVGTAALTLRYRSIET